MLDQLICVRLEKDFLDGDDHYGRIQGAREGAVRKLFRHGPSSQCCLEIVVFDSKVNVFVDKQHFETVSMVCWSEKYFCIWHEDGNGNKESEMRVWAKPGDI